MFGYSDETLFLMSFILLESVFSYIKLGPASQYRPQCILVFSTGVFDANNNLKVFFLQVISYDEFIVFVKESPASKPDQLLLHQ